MEYLLRFTHDWLDTGGESTMLLS